MLSALEHLKDIDTYYVITPKPEAWLEGFGDKYGDRVRFVDESIFPFQMADFSRVPFPNKGWYLQQMLKVCSLQYVTCSCLYSHHLIFCSSTLALC